MAAVADLERFLERVFERTSARVFRGRPQAVQAERRVERAMEAARAGRGSDTVVPSRYRVRLHPADLDDLATRSGGAEALAGRLADAALAFARRHAYRLVARPTVILVADPTVQRGRIEVDALEERPSTAEALPVPVDLSPAPAPDGDPAPPSPTPGEGVPAPVVLPGPAVPAPATHGVRTDLGGTTAFRRPAPAPARAQLRQTSGGIERTIEVDAAPLSIGRAVDNAIVLSDPRVSRHHGRLQARRGTLVYTDLGSTNGSRVNGIRADECVLGLGDRLQLGDVVLVVERLPG
jgi:hypothetical protein